MNYTKLLNSIDALKCEIETLCDAVDELVENDDSNDFDSLDEYEEALDNLAETTATIPMTDKLPMAVITCQNCSQLFRLETCEKGTVASFNYRSLQTSYICPHCKHANYNDSIAGRVKIDHLEL